MAKALEVIIGYNLSLDPIVFLLVNTEGLVVKKVTDLHVIYNISFMLYAHLVYI